MYLFKNKIIEIRDPRLKKIRIRDLGLTSRIRNNEKNNYTFHLQMNWYRVAPSQDRLGTACQLQYYWCQCCGSGMIFLDPGSEFIPSRIRIEEFKYFNPKIVSNLS